MSNVGMYRACPSRCAYGDNGVSFARYLEIETEMFISSNIDGWLGWDFFQYQKISTISVSKIDS